VTGKEGGTCGIHKAENFWKVIQKSLPLASANGYQSIHDSGFSRIFVPTIIGTSSRVILSS
ncbi:MAG: hypothetical protein BRD50_09430, partial [Bacteroidetes bacterium SW_11_45_7]